jgi:hypothetical protein
MDQRLVHLTPHIIPCYRSYSWISGGDNFLVKNMLMLAFGIIENCRSWLFLTRMGVLCVTPLVLLLLKLEHGIINIGIAYV